ncbi:MAG: Flp pilus assembly protein CpaB [Actinomycetota bacterium]
MSRRTLALVLAVALALLATLALYSYIKSLEDKAFEGSEIVEVFVAKQDIGAGVSGDTAGSQGLIERRTVPAKVRPSGAITSLTEISGKIAIVQIFKDEIIVAPRFQVPGAAAARVLPIGEGKQAISLQVGQVPGVAGFIQPGDRVSLIAQTAQRPGATSTTARQAGPFVHYLLQNMDVIAVGSRVAAQTAATPATPTDQQAQQQACCILTFSVTPAQAEIIAFAALNTQMYFTLLPDAKQPPANTPGRQVTNLFS